MPVEVYKDKFTGKVQEVVLAPPKRKVAPGHIRSNWAVVPRCRFCSTRGRFQPARDRYRGLGCQARVECLL